MFLSEIVNPYITLFYLRGFRAYKPPTHFMWTTIRFTKKLSVDCHHKGHIVLSHKTLEQFEYQATNRLLLAASEEYGDSGTTRKMLRRHQPIQNATINSK